MGGARYLFVAAALALSACGEDDPDVDRVMRDLANDVAEQTGTEDVTVECSDDVSEGDVCDVRAPGGLQAKVRITRLNEGDVEGEIVPP